MRITKTKKNANHSLQKANNPITKIFILTICLLTCKTRIHSTRKQKLQNQQRHKLRDMESLLEKMESLEIVHIPGPLDLQSLTTAQQNSNIENSLFAPSDLESNAEKQAKLEMKQGSGYSYHGRQVEVSSAISSKLRAMRRSRLRTEQRKLNNAKDDLKETIEKIKRKNKDKTDMKGWGFGRKQAKGFSGKFADMAHTQNLFQNYDKALRNMVPEYMKENLVLTEMVEFDLEIPNREKFHLTRIQKSRDGDYLECDKYPEKNKFIKSNGKIYVKNKIVRSFQKFELEHGLEDDLNTLVNTEVQKEIKEKKKAEEKKRQIEENLEKTGLEGNEEPVSIYKGPKSQKSEVNLGGLEKDIDASVELGGEELEKDLSALMKSDQNSAKVNGYLMKKKGQFDDDFDKLMKEDAMGMEEKFDNWVVDNGDVSLDITPQNDNQSHRKILGLF